VALFRFAALGKNACKNSDISIGAYNARGVHAKERRAMTIYCDCPIKLVICH